jgi:crotonobetainyl-CoA:carnitine CoA-transferase CaiB-like acyl-CoA transferase
LYGALARELETTFLSRETRAWLDALLSRGVPVAPCVPVAAMFEDEHLCANDLWWDMEDPRWGAVRQTGALIKWAGMSQALVRRAPQLGEHSAEVLREFGVDADAAIAAGVVRQA